MRVLLDECAPRKLRRELAEHDVSTVGEAGWGGKKNGLLLQLAAERFDVLLTVDSNLEYQQNLVTLPIAVVVLVAVSNDINDLLPLIPQLRELLPSVNPTRARRRLIVLPARSYVPQVPARIQLRSRFGSSSSMLGSHAAAWLRSSVNPLFDWSLLRLSTVPGS